MTTTALPKTSPSEPPMPLQTTRQQEECVARNSIVEFESLITDNATKDPTATSATTQLDHDISSSSSSTISKTSRNHNDNDNRHHRRHSGCGSADDSRSFEDDSWGSSSSQEESDASDNGGEVSSCMGIQAWPGSMMQHDDDDDDPFERILMEGGIAFDGSGSLFLASMLARGSNPPSPISTNNTDNCGSTDDDDDDETTDESRNKSPLQLADTISKLMVATNSNNLSTIIEEDRSAMDSCYASFLLNESMMTTQVQEDEVGHDIIIRTEPHVHHFANACSAHSLQNALDCIAELSFAGVFDS